MSEQYFYTLPAKAGEQHQLGQLVCAALALECAKITDRHHGPVLTIVPDMQFALRLREEVRQFTELPVIHLADWGTLPYESASPYKDIISARLSTLYQLPTLTRGIIIMPVRTLMQRVCPYSFLHKYALIIRNGQKLSCDSLRVQLEQAGYRYVNDVMEHGEYSTCGEILDLYPMGSHQPYRIHFFDKKIDNLHLFDIYSQSSMKAVNTIHLLPAHEFPTNKAAIELFRNRWCKIFDAYRKPEHIYQQVSEGMLPAGIEYWQPLFFKQELPTLFRYLPTNTLILNSGDIQTSVNSFWQNANAIFENSRIDLIQPLLDPVTLWLPPDVLLKELKAWPNMKLSAETLPKKASNTNLGYQHLPELTLQAQAKEPLNQLCQFLEYFKGEVIFSVESEGRRENLQDLLARIKLYPQLILRFEETAKQPYRLMIGASEYGFIDTNHQRALICESDILGKSISRWRQDNCRTINPDILTHHLDKIQPGQPLVHIDHGVGRYIGLMTLEVGGIESEYLMLSYAGNTKLYVPVSSLHMISRYSGSSNDNAPLHKLGSDTWTRTFQKAAKKVRDVVAELLDIYAHRSAKTGFAFKHHHKKYQLFCKGFPFETTPDQALAITAVLNDMCQPMAMDRLICGDVGFGKTEVAMRAAFLTVENGKQVAVLVPTTLLAQQHYNNFCDRFANWPVRIEMLSRFLRLKEQTQVLEHTREGKIDILISTHKLLMNDLKWHDLGLLIVDEEHRFGVRHKERIKAMRSDIDILTLTATPIPRTLNMALIGMRDLSVISTPPARRLAVKTFVREYDSMVVRKAILREVLRGGQIYYLYNEVKNIEQVAKRLAKLVPEARIAIGHGQMRGRDLERVMNDFYHRRFNVLVCTTIIETGIDVPSANTIIIECVDHFGLAQLHQLRGRVGRSHYQAYAWLLTPSPQVMTTDAQKRLKAITSLEDLGAGFALAIHDLEIRGAGKLLGEEQSGQMETIGFTLYMELLRNAVDSLKAGREPSLEDLTSNQTEIEMRIPALLQEEFISDVNIRLALYKRIASAKCQNELDTLKVEIIDHFGKLPDAARNFLDIAALRLIARKIGIRRIEANDKGGFFEFMTQNQVDPNWLINLLQKDPKKWKLDGPTRLKFNLDLTDRKLRLEWVQNFIDKLANNQIR